MERGNTMKRRRIIAALVAASMLFAACEKTEETQPAETTQAAHAQQEFRIVDPNETESEESGTAQTEAGPVELTLDNYFDTDPADTEFGQGDGAGIISLVDLNYIESSMDDVFEIDSPEDLASLVYFVNTYPLQREYENGEEHFYLHVNLNSDLDLSAYDWVSMGITEDEHAQSFAGIFLGNGHTISGLDPEVSLFEDIYFSTVCGLTLDSGTVTVNDSALLADVIYQSNFFDCHVLCEIAEGEDDDPEIRFNVYNTDQNNRFIDCSVDTVGSDGETIVDEFTVNGYGEGMSNTVLEFYSPALDGTYTYGADFFAAN